MMIAGIASRKQPTTRNTNAMKKPTPTMPSPHDVTFSSSALGIWKYASSQPNTDAVPTQNSAIAESLPVSSSACHSCLRVHLAIEASDSTAA